MYRLKPWSSEWILCSLGFLWPTRLVMKQGMKAGDGARLHAALGASAFSLVSHLLPVAEHVRLARLSPRRRPLQISRENGDRALQRINELFRETDEALSDGRKFLCGAGGNRHARLSLIDSRLRDEISSLLARAQATGSRPRISRWPPWPRD